MKLTRETYEAWLLDRMEGALTPAQEAALEAFLLQHPELAPSTGPLPRIRASSGLFPEKEQLRRTFPPAGAPDAARLDDFLVARLEEELTSAQEHQLERYVYEHPGAERHAALMAMAKVPDEPLPFTGKERLQRQFPPQGLPDIPRLMDFLIAELEGDLTTAQQEALQALLAGNAAARHEQELVNATRVQSERLIYPWKQELKQRELRVFTSWSRLAIAASVLLVLGAGSWLLRKNSGYGIGLAKVGSKEAVHRPSSASTAGASVESDPTDRTHPEEPPATQPAEVSDAAQRKEPSTVGKVKPRKANAYAPGEKPAQELEHTPQPPGSPPPVIDRLPVKEPPLAQLVEQPVPEPIGPTPPPAFAATDRNEALAMVNTQTAGQSLGTFVANTVRSEVLSTPQRADVLDGQDALALADKAIGTVTGGRGGIELQRNASGERIKLRFGNTLSLSTSRSR